jgi:hypothetical protein
MLAEVSQSANGVADGHNVMMGGRSCRISYVIITDYIMFAAGDSEIFLGITQNPNLIFCTGLNTKANFFKIFTVVVILVNIHIKFMDK